MFEQRRYCARESVLLDFIDSQEDMVLNRPSTR
jgi:hypothetical protein